MASRGQRSKQKGKAEVSNSRNSTNALSKRTPAAQAPKGSNKALPSHLRPPTASSKGKENESSGGEAAPVKKVAQTNDTPSPAKEIVKLFVQGPARKGQASFSDPILVDLLELLGQRCHVQIENGVHFPGSLLVSGTQISFIKRARRDICGLMHRVNSYVPQRDIWVQYVSSSNNMLLGNPEPSIQLIDVDTSSESANVPLSLQATEFQARFSKMEKIIGAVPDRLCMQLEFGRLRIDITDDDCLSGLEGGGCLEASLSMLAVKGATTFNRCVGGENLFFALREKVLHDAKDRFYPCLPTTAELDDIQPEKCLLVSTEGFLVELDISIPVSSSKTGLPGLPIKRVFQKRLSAGNVDMTAVYRDCHLDWNLGMMQEIDAKDIPPVIKSIASNIKVQSLTSGGNFPMPAFTANFTQASRVKQITGRMTWTVGCKGTRYKMELALSREWMAPKDTNMSAWSTGIALRCDSWDEILGQKNWSRQARPLGQGLERLFAPGETDNGVDDLLAVAKEVLTLSESVLSTNEGEEDKAMARLPSTGTLQHRDRKVVSVDELAKLLASMPAKATKKPLPALQVPPEQDSRVQVDEDLIVFD